MDRNLLKSVLYEYTVEIPKYVVNHRDIRFEEMGNYVFVGMRRAGKSYILYQRMQELLAKGVKPHEMLYINFEDERLAGMETRDLNLLLETHLEMHGVRPILFLDEVQNVSGWEKFARRLADTKYRVYISGSDAKMLSADIQTTLGGRYFVVDVYPYGFKEYLTANDIDFSSNAIMSTQGRAAILKEFNDYFRFGGLPECVMLSLKRDYLNSVYQKIYLGDIAGRNPVSNLLALRVLFKKLAESIKQPISYNRIANVVSSTGVKISVNTVINYIEYAKDAWLISTIQNITGKLVDKETAPKYYFTDNAILNLFLLDGNTSLLENVVAVNLLRKYGRNDAVYFYNKGIEVDFYIPDTYTAIQVCYNLDNSDGTFDREVKALLKITEVLECRKLQIITRDTEERILKMNGKEIEVVPVWKWLLNEANE